ncbi:hypothetical protein E0E54_20500 [Azotobacter chroococcum]|uniref:hypothetical protein n=1 Tax=Azotobacter chroococcum TaxID=353 RepID=UPI00103B0ADE|nr:hypothetical protein [Azotobacter chroococcum]TBW03319.1 hypothetical protein E0E52_15770 [Azotobacter chroococcum]TBW32073.1 hypothetical protein E0E54_20500 [Azotobacter chroococcum]
MNHNNETLGEALLNDIKNTVKLGLRELLKEGDKLIQEGQLSLDDYLAQKTTGLDQYILHEQSARQLDFVSGEVFIALQEGDKFAFGVDLYFTDTNKQWVKSAHVDTPKPISIYFLKEDQARIRDEKKIAYTYDKPDA